MVLKNEFHGANLGYVLELYERYRQDPNAVDEATRRYFAAGNLEFAEPAIQPELSLQKASVAAADLAQAIRSYGYLGASLDPLGSTPPGDPVLVLASHGLTEADLRSLPASLVGSSAESGRRDAFEAIEALRSIYCGAIGYDYGHVCILEERQWLRESAERGRFRPPAQGLEEIGLLDRLCQVEAFELFLHRIYPGKTRFSIEGLDMLVPMLDEIVGAAARAGLCAILIGMGHRGRLNVLAHVLKKPYEQILAEFKDPRGRATTWDELGWTGDVKYHLGGYKSAESRSKNGTDLVIHLPSNPSHLEYIDPIIQGIARAADSAVDRRGEPRLFLDAALSILIHGDASFPGQGIVSETFNLSQLPGYTIGGCLHIITNNQLGFTATERESRSSLHASDPAKGFEIPIIHVNADDPLACVEAARTAIGYRMRFHKDFVINLIGYRRYGHNEGDEPRFTQPVMYQQIDAHPSVRKLWASRLIENRIVSQARAEQALQATMQTLQQIDQDLDPERALKEATSRPPPPGAARKIKTAVPLKRLQALNEALLIIPDGFNLNPKLRKAVERRRAILEDPREATVDWATAESLALASIVEDGIPVRLTGEDVARGTFNQRHAVFYDVKTNQPHTPLQQIPQARASFEVHNSPLTEAAALGFEFGYNVQASGCLVLWEAQYGDFINIAQTMVDEFLLSSRAKWGLTPSLVLLLPHGNEGQGPDHSSARIERFLGLAAEGNQRLAVPSTAAQYFHLLRRQALLLKTDPLPLVIFTPKGLLRHPLVSSPPRLFSQGSWQPVIDDPRSGDAGPAVRSLLLCSGRIYVDLVTSDWREKDNSVAVARLEQLYPFPQDDLEQLFEGYPDLERAVWVQEEPLNMGAWDYLRPRLRELLKDRCPLQSVARPESSSPAEGSTTLYRLNQEALVKQAYNPEIRPESRSVVIEKG
jgi:2-oxoglutarate dehydrogenase E1 component